MAGAESHTAVVRFFTFQDPALRYALIGSILLGVNIDHAATLRQARYRNEPRTCGGAKRSSPSTRRPRRAR